MPLKSPSTPAYSIMSFFFFFWRGGGGGGGGFVDKVDVQELKIHIPE
jgi:hypothetical protein